MKWTTKGINVIKTLGYNVLIPAPQVDELGKIDADIEYTVSITKKTKRRSLNANAYAWVLCDKIARELSKHGYFSKIDVYKRVIRECGAFTLLPIKTSATERYIEIWEHNGIGWYAEDLGAAKTEGYNIVRAYHGSSVYTTEEMKRLIDALVDECAQLNIRIDDSDYVNSLIGAWGDEQKKET